MNNQKRNILERGISVESINKEAKTEKVGGGKSPLSNMHYYFTRKPLISSRLVLAGTLLDSGCAKSTEEFNRLMGIDNQFKKRAYKTIPSSLISKINSSYPDGVTILDPFAGSGMIPFEALRLGLNVVALDYNPVAYLIMKATLDYPLMFGKIIDESGQRKLVVDVSEYLSVIKKNLKEQFSHLYPTHNGSTVRGYIYSWSVVCPTCGKQTPLVNSWWLDTGKKIRLDYKITKEGQIIFKVIKTNKGLEGTVTRGKATCLFCSSKLSNDHITADISKNQREIMLAVSLENGTLELPTEEDLKAIIEARDYLKQNISILAKFIPNEEMPNDMRALPAKKYLKYWYKLFNPRQLLLISSIAKEIRTIVEDVAKKDPEYASAIGTYLSMILANHLNHNSRSSVWIAPPGGQIVSNSIFNRGLSMSWNHAESNPLSESSGSLSVSGKSVLDGLKFATEELNRNTLGTKSRPKLETYQASILSWRPKRKFKFIITDPPYYDDVPYPEVLQFFQVWHSRTIGDLLNFTGVPSVSEDLSVGGNRDEKTFENRLMVAIKNIFNLLEDDGVLVMFYAHRSISGWKYLLESLRQVGFNVTSTVALMTENKESVITKGRIAIFHSLLLTARKRIDEKTIDIVDLEDEIRKKIEARYLDLEEIYGQDRMNLLLAASGIVIETITGYSEIKSFTKNTADYALEMGQRFLIEAFAKRTLNISNADPKTMVYTWFRHSMNDSIEFSVFNQTLKALGVSEEAISDIYKPENGKDGKCLRLLDFAARGTLEVDGMEPLVANSVIDAVHIALRAYIRGGVTSSRASVVDSPFGREAVLNAINALARLYEQKNDYREGEICKQFLEEWNSLYGGKQRTFK